MKTKKEKSLNAENKSFNLLRKDELMKIKGGEKDEIIEGTPTVIDGEFD